MIMLNPDPDSILDEDPQPSPLWDYTAIPYTDDICKHLIDNAVTALILVRGGNPGDPGATISVLDSLIAEAQARLPDAVADACDGGYTWASIALRLATTVPAVRYRYADYARRRRLNLQP